VNRLRCVITKRVHRWISNWGQRVAKASVGAVSRVCLTSPKVPRKRADRRDKGPFGASLAGEVHRYHSTSNGLERRKRRTTLRLCWETRTFSPAKTVRSKYRRKHARASMLPVPREIENGAENCDATRTRVLVIVSWRLTRLMTVAWYTESHGGPTDFQVIKTRWINCKWPNFQSLLSHIWRIQKFSRGPLARHEWKFLNIIYEKTDINKY